MAHASAARSVQSGALEARGLLFKPDRPRDIDRYIDYFGSTEPHAHDDSHMCGETLLERPA